MIFYVIRFIGILVLAVFGLILFFAKLDFSLAYNLMVRFIAFMAIICAMGMFKFYYYNK